MYSILQPSKLAAENGKWGQSWHCPPLPPHGLWGRNKCACIAGGSPVLHFLASSSQSIKLWMRAAQYLFGDQQNDTFEYCKHSVRPVSDLFTAKTICLKKAFFLELPTNIWIVFNYSKKIRLSDCRICKDDRVVQMVWVIETSQFSVLLDGHSNLV